MASSSRSDATGSSAPKVKDTRAYPICAVAPTTFTGTTSGSVPGSRMAAVNISPGSGAVPMGAAKPPDEMSKVVSFSLRPCPVSSTWSARATRSDWRWACPGWRVRLCAASRARASSALRAR